MYVKTLNKSRFAEMAYFKRDGEFWIPLDEYGERTKHTTFNHFCVFDWLNEFMFFVFGGLCGWLLGVNHDDLDNNNDDEDDEWKDDGEYDYLK